ncbi:50S ribosomal protein L25 [Candidatus Mycosynbacter amalyticus]|uniref:Large ribosomal subunit protein bL25 n=1 Tax=Candidatus Mycosynbacter amalyticus TaxID=2665156 RepID=A0A857MPN9_9BACT|nr:50S ribosomal protein L25 [Candidatus Mycosynbacter amalyticus]QHN43051.1 50S ribosomal protein L25 [Candidatus Mycosynbacter amalyticus]
MGNKIELKLDEREVHGKKVAQLRKQSIVPAVVYGPGMKPVSVQADHNVLKKVHQQAGSHSPVHLTIGSKKRIAMIKDVEFDVVKHTINHVSFHAVKANEPVNAEIPIHLIGQGESEAEKAGLIVLQSLEKIEVKALPMDLPEAFEVSIAELKEAGDKLTVADITVPTNVEIVDNDDGREGTADDEVTIMDLAIASVYEPSALQAANDAAGGDAEDASADSVEAEKGSEEETSEEKSE